MNRVVKVLQNLMPKLANVTNVTLHWYTRGIEFPAAEAPQNRSMWSVHSCPLGLVVSRPMVRVCSQLQPPNPCDYSLRLRPLAGSCITGVAFCI